MAHLSVLKRCEKVVTSCPGTYNSSTTQQLIIHPSKVNNDNQQQQQPEVFSHFSSFVLE
jgi:hypothetical protein